MSDKIKGFCVLILILTNGCAFLLPPKPPGAGVTVDSFHEDIGRYPDAGNADIEGVGEVILNAPINKVYERLLDISHGMKEDMPSGVFLLVDHSKSDAGSDQWGVGSTVQFKHGKHTAVAAIEACQRPNLIVVKVLHARNGQTGRVTMTHELKETPDGKTNLTVSKYVSSPNKVSSSWISDWYRERSIKKSLSKMVEVFGGEVIRVEADVNKDAAPIQ